MINWLAFRKEPMRAALRSMIDRKLRRFAVCANEPEVLVPIKVQQFAETANAQNDGDSMKGFVKDIESLAVQNDKFRHVLYTAKIADLPTHHLFDKYVPIDMNR